MYIFCSVFQNLYPVSGKYRKDFFAYLTDSTVLSALARFFLAGGSNVSDTPEVLAAPTPYLNQKIIKYFNPNTYKWDI